MKHLQEYRNPELIKSYLDQIKKIVTKPWTIMEICGGQTHGLVKNGILDLLPSEINMIHGPGCPVCVTPISVIDQAINLSMRRGVILCSFGDMLRVPGSESSLLEAKANGADIRMLYSPLEAVTIASENPQNEVVFFAVGFETTAPANALAVLQAHRKKLKNFSILVSHVTVPPAIEAIMSDEECNIQGFLAAGHVCAIMGTSEYETLCRQLKIPMVVTGFEPVDLMHGILMIVNQLENGESRLENQYKRIVRPEGNKEAVKLIKEVFTICDKEWRGIGTIPKSGFRIHEKYWEFDAIRKLNPKKTPIQESSLYIAGQILKGLKKPIECPAFENQCSPENPLGAPMVSSEGACSAYYQYKKDPVL